MGKKLKLNMNDDDETDSSTKLIPTECIRAERRVVFFRRTTALNSESLQSSWTRLTTEEPREPRDCCLSVLLPHQLPQQFINFTLTPLALFRPQFGAQLLINLLLPFILHVDTSQQQQWH